MRHGRKILMVLGVVLLPVGLGGCETIREYFGYTVPPPKIVEEHLSPCQQPQRGAPARNCAGVITGYTPMPVEKKQEFVTH